MIDVRVGQIYACHVSACHVYACQVCVFLVEQQGTDRLGQVGAESKAKPIGNLVSHGRKHMPGRILIVDDDENIVRLLKLYLGDAGYDVDVAVDGSSALTRFHAGKPDLVLLDVMMPVINGWEVLRLIRGESATPVIMLTSRDLVEDKVKGFDLGADDYVIKPFEPREVLARIQVRMSKREPGAVEVHEGKAAEKERGVAECGNLRVDLNRYEVLKDGVKVVLKPKEIQLLYFLLQNRNRVFSRDQLLEKVWEYDFMVDTRTVDVHVKRLRQMLEPSNSSWSLKTVWGVGYKMETR